MGTILDNKLYDPAHLEAAATWEGALRTGFQAHGDWHGHTARTVPFRKVHVNKTYGSDSNHAEAIGRPDYPYATLAAALAAIPNGGNIGLATGTHIILQGSNAVTSGNPTAKYPTGGATLQVPSYCIIEGAGADADRSRASCLIEDTVATGPLLEVAGRYVELRNFGVRNLSTNSASSAIQSTGISGGMQNLTMEKVHAYGSYRGLIMQTFNVDCSRFLQCQFSNNQREGLVIQSDGSNAPNQLYFLSCDFNQNNTDVVAGTANVKMVADSAGSHNAYFMAPKIHGFSTRFDIQGWNNLWVLNGYFEIGSSGYGGLYDNAPMVKVTSNPNGTTQRYWSHNINFVGNRFHSPHGGVPANWTAGVPVVADVDRCYGFHFENNMCDDNIDIDATNPALRFGADCLDLTMAKNKFVSGATRVPITDPSALYSKNAALLSYNLRGDVMGDIW